MSVMQRIHAMKWLFAIAALSLAALSTTPATAQNIPRNERILVDYHDPLDPELVYNVDPDDTDDETKKLYANYREIKAVADRLKERKVLERYAQFLAPLKLRTTLRLIGKQCNQVNAFFNPRENSITLCYEYVRSFENGAPRGQTDDGITRDDAIIGGLVATMLHETGHALFHLFKIPVLGREEDGADQIAAYVMLQFGDQVALTTVKGSIWKWRNWGVPVTQESTAFTQQRIFSDTHSTAQQRFNTFLCIAYGGKPATFQSFIDAGYIPKARAASCRGEYQRAERAFIKTILPHIDQDLMNKVRSAQWFYPQDQGAIPVQTR